jgi:uncharacterized membrane protein
VGRSFEVAAVVVLVVGFLAALVGAGIVWRTSGSARVAYRTLRELLGGGLLIALEILVAADLVSTVAVAPTLENVAVLGLIVLIRTFLSFSLETEIEGVFPWRRATGGLGPRRPGRGRRGSSGAGDAPTGEERLPGGSERSPVAAPEPDRKRWRHDRA